MPGIPQPKRFPALAFAIGLSAFMLGQPAQADTGHLSDYYGPSTLATNAEIESSVTIYIGDLDLSTQAGYEQLQQRVRSTASSLCAALERQQRARSPLENRHDCVRNATRDALSRTELAEASGT